MNRREYLEAYKKGKIKKGLGIDLVDLDEAIRYKQGQFVMINGFDNVGKTAWIMWYFLCLAVKHNITFCIWSGENNDGMLVRQLIEMLTGKKLKELELNEIYNYEAMITNWFYFVPNDKLYKAEDLHEICLEKECKALLIDPYTGLDRDYDHKANYNFLNTTREFCNKHKITTYVNTHPNTNAARMTYPADHELNGYQMPPSRSQTEGGQPFANRVDDFITIHRLVGHPVHGFNTQIYIRKVKDTETGGKVSPVDFPLSFEWNNGLGFTCGGYNPLKKKVEVNQPELKSIETNTNFIKEPEGFDWLE